MNIVSPAATGWRRKRPRRVRAVHRPSHRASRAKPLPRSDQAQAQQMAAAARRHSNNGAEHYPEHANDGKLHRRIALSGIFYRAPTRSSADGAAVRLIRACHVSCSGKGGRLRLAAGINGGWYGHQSARLAIICHTEISSSVSRSRLASISDRLRNMIGRERGDLVQIAAVEAQQHATDTVRTVARRGRLSAAPARRKCRSARDAQPACARNTSA